MNNQSYQDEVLSGDIKRLSGKIGERFALQEELKTLKAKTPKSDKVIEKKLKDIRGLSQDILDLSLYIGKQRPTDPVLNRKRWAVMFELFRAEEKQINGLLSSPTLALSILIDRKKDPTTHKETQND